MKATSLLVTRFLLAAIGAVLIGCGRPSDHQDGKLILHFATWGGAKDGNEYDKIVADIYAQFERENPDILLREESVPGEYVAKMSLAYIADAQPDVMILDASSAALFINSHLVADLMPYVRRTPSVRLDDFFPNAVAIARRGNALYALPNDFTPMVVYYNKRLFDHAGLAYPTADWDFARFREVAKRLTVPGAKRSDPPKQYGFAFSNWPAGWVMWLWNNGADHLSASGRAEGYLDSPKSAQAVEFLRDLVLRDGVAPSISQAASMGVDPFANGEAAMTISGHWSLIGYANAPKGRDGKPKITWDDLGVVALPHETPQSQTVMYESGYAIAARSWHKGAAWRFISYMTSARVQRRYQSSGIAVPGRKDIARERAASSPLEAAFLPIIPSARAPYGSRIEGYEFVEEQMQKAMDGILGRGRDVPSALAEAARKIDREFAKK